MLSLKEVFLTSRYTKTFFWIFIGVVVPLIKYGPDLFQNGEEEQPVADPIEKPVANTSKPQKTTLDLVAGATFIAQIPAKTLSPAETGFPNPYFVSARTATLYFRKDGILERTISNATPAQANKTDICTWKYYSEGEGLIKKGEFIEEEQSQDHARKNALYGDLGLNNNNLKIISRSILRYYPAEDCIKHVGYYTTIGSRTERSDLPESKWTTYKLSAR